MPRGRKTKVEEIDPVVLAEDEAYQREVEAEQAESQADTLAPVIEVEPFTPADGESIAKRAYNKMREEITDGTFPDWEDLSDRTRKPYEEAADACQQSCSPRTRYEQIVLELLNV